MTEPTASPAPAEIDLDAAEERDDETRLATLESLLTHLEAELERDDPSAEANRPG